MSPSMAPVLRILALVAFVTGLALLGAHMLLGELLLVSALTAGVYAIAGAGLIAALLALLAARGAGSGTRAPVGVIAAALNLVLIAATFFATTTLVALPRVTFALGTGETLPAFAVAPITLEGQPLALEDFRGKPVVLLFHRGGWCPFCQAELVGLNDRYDDLAPLATVIAISGDLPDAVAAYARARDLRYTLAHDADGAVAHQYGLTYDGGERGELTAPAAIILDREGRIAWFHVAEDVRDRPDPDELLDVLGRLP